MRQVKGYPFFNETARIAVALSENLRYGVLLAEDQMPREPEPRRNSDRRAGR